jgi:hypothetical protein
MEIPGPKTFNDIFAALFSLVSVMAIFISLKNSLRSHSIRLCAIALIGGLSLFCNNVWVYAASVFIIATAITETEFLQNLAAILRGSSHYFDYKKAISGEIPQPKETIKAPRQKMEFKILNTLWTKQVNKFPLFDQLFTFLISQNAPEYMKFRESGGKLIGEGLVGETEIGHYYLTPEGWNYCKEHYKEFPSDQWWPSETIDENNLKKVIKNV